MAGLPILAAAAATALLVAASLRLGLVATLLAAYLVYVFELTLVVLVLSPVREVDCGGIAVLEFVLLAGAVAVWWRRGRYRPRLLRRDAVHALARDPVTLGFLCLALAALAYELLLGLSAPANDYDGLAYHLVRAAAWTEHSGYFWVPNAPYDPINEYPPIAEQQILFLFATVGRGLLLTLPQYLAELAVLTAVAGTARRIGFDTRSALRASALLATFGLVGLEASTAQNDLVAASFPLLAAFFLLGERRSEHVLAGVAVGIALGVKLTTVLALPVVLVLALLRGRRAALAALAGAIGSFVALSMWVYVLNVIHTGHLLGHGGGRTGNEASPSYPASLVTALYILYTLMDKSALSQHLISELAYVGVAAALAIAIAGVARRERVRRALKDGGRVLIPFLAPLIVIGTGGVIAWITRRMGYPARGPLGAVGNLTSVVNSGVSAFGPLGAVALLGVIALTLLAAARRRASAPQVALALALPVFLVALSLVSKWNAYLPRFFLVPVALTAPLLARLLRGRLVSCAYLVVAAGVCWLTLTNDIAKPLRSVYGRPWDLTQVEALALVEPEDVQMLETYDRLVPSGACVGAALGQDEPAYLLYGPRLQRQVVFLPAPSTPGSEATVEAAYGSDASYVVISTGMEGSPPESLAQLRAEFSAAGWRLRGLGGYWLLAVSPHPSLGPCTT